MARINEAILNGAYTRGMTRPMLDATYGGQQGWSPNFAEWVSNQAYVSSPVVCLLMEPPSLFKEMPDSQKWISSLKSLFELHSRTIDGLNAGLKVDTDEHPVGGGGEMQQEPTNVTRERSNPKHTFIEKEGRPIQTLLDFWIRYCIQDPETKFALAGTMGKNIPDLLADRYAATCLYFVPNRLHNRVDKAWLVTNMFPLSNGDITGKRDLTTAQEMLTLDIEFSGIAQVGVGVNNLAQTMLDRIRTDNADPYMKTAFMNRVSPDVDAIATGYKGWTETVGRTSVTNMGR